LLLAFWHLYTTAPNAKKDCRKQSIVNLNPNQKPEVCSKQPGSNKRTNGLQVAGSSQPTNDQTSGERSIDIEHVHV
jgi:hypothetical protein